MASFTDDPRLLTNFPGFVKTLDSADVIGVGMIKQAQFDQGVEKVQSEVDYLSSLPIAKEEVSGYVQTRLGQLRDAVTKNLAGDFSDQRIINQIGGAARTLARDPIVQNGVQSTARMQTALSELQEAKKAGKSSIQNEAFLNNYITSWLNDGQLDSSFSGSYVPYTDYVDKLTKAFKDLNPGQDIPKDAFRYDPAAVSSTNPEGRVVNPVLFKGVGPKRIQEVWNLISSQPDVQQQLQIDGWYRYNGATPNQLGQDLEKRTNATLNDINAVIANLSAKRSMGAIDSATASQIAEYQQMAANEKKSFERLNSIIHSNNPEAVKTELVKNETLASFIVAHAYQTMEKSPLWETSYQERVFDRERAEFKMNYDRLLAKDQWDMYKDEETLRLAREKAKKEAPGGSDTVTEGQIITAEIPTGSEAAYNNVKSSLEGYNQTVLELVSRATGGGPDSPAILDNVTNQWKYNFGPNKRYKTLEEAYDAVSKVYATQKDVYDNGGATDEMAVALIERAGQKWDNYQSNNKIISDVESKYSTQLEKLTGQVGDSDVVKAAIVDRKLPGWEEYEKQLIGRYGENYMENIGIIRGGGKVVQPLEKYDAFNKAVSIIEDDKSIPLQFKDREEEYTRRLSTGIPYTVTHNVDKPEDRERTNRLFFALADSRAVNAKTGKGDAADILELTGKSPDKRKGLQYQSRVDPQTGAASIKITDGTDVYTMGVSQSEYERQFPERIPDNRFREKYGARLNLTQQTSTDPIGEYSGGGFTNAYPVRTDKPDFPYTVRYHLVKQGTNQYGIKWWVVPKPTADNPSPTPIINGEYASGTLIGMPPQLSEEEVVEWTDKMRDSQWLKDQLLYKFRPKQ